MEYPLDARQRPSLILFAAVLAGVIAVLAVRSLFGAGFWGDEPYGLSTAVRYAQGDRPLVDSWDTNFSSAMLAVPFVRAYLAVHGSADGILLAFRWVWVAIMALTAVVGFAVLRRTIGPWLALVVSVLVGLYLPYLSPYVGYGADWSWHIMAGLVAVGASLARRGRVWLFGLAGALTGLGVVGNPPTIAAVPVMALGFWVVYRRERSMRTAALTCYLVGASVVGAAFVGALLSVSGAEAFEGVRHLSAAEDHDFALGAYLGRLWFVRYVLTIPVAAGFGAGIAYRRRGGDTSGRAATVAAALALALGVVAFAVQRIAPLHAPQAFVFMCGASMFFALLATGQLRLSRTQTLLLFAAAGPAIGWFLGSNGGFVTAIQTSPLLLAAALEWVAGPPEHGARQPGLAVAIALAAVVAAVGLVWTPEGTTPQMTARIANGPFAGVFTTPAEARRLDALDDSLRSLPRIEGRTVYFERFPLGYLYEGVRPGTYSTWSTSATSGRIDEYVRLTGNQPERVVLTRFAEDLEDGRFPERVRMSEWDEFRLVHEDDELRVYER